MLGGDESTQVTAGISGFLVLFFLALVCVLLFRSMNGHLRRMRFEQREDEFRSRVEPSEPDADEMAQRPRT